MPNHDFIGNLTVDQIDMFSDCNRFAVKLMNKIYPAIEHYKSVPGFVGCECKERYTCDMYDCIEDVMRRLYETSDFEACLSELTAIDAALCIYDFCDYKLACCDVCRKIR